LGTEKCRALRFFHALSGCDTVSAFALKGKKSFWDTWSRCSEITECFAILSSQPTINDVESLLKHVERFIVILYDRGSKASSVNEARMEMFSKQGRGMEAIPPTQSALLQHMKRAVYQAGYCWAQSLKALQVLPSVEEWGWSVTKDGCFPYWTNIAQASEACYELIKCGCKKGCGSKACKCVKANLKCTALCKCGDNCATKCASS
jgi:hypothetical protein